MEFPEIPLLSTEHEHVGTCARRSTGQPTPKKRPRDGDSGAELLLLQGIQALHFNIDCGNPTLP